MHEQKYTNTLSSLCQVTSEGRVLDLESEVLGSILTKLNIYSLEFIVFVKYSLWYQNLHYCQCYVFFVLLGCSQVCQSVQFMNIARTSHPWDSENRIPDNLKKANWEEILVTVIHWFNIFIRCNWSLVILSSESGTSVVSLSFLFNIIYC